MESETKEKVYRIIDWVFDTMTDEFRDSPGETRPGYVFVKKPGDITDDMIHNPSRYTVVRVGRCCSICGEFGHNKRRHTNAGV
jgi:hypothetical protein